VSRSAALGGGGGAEIPYTVFDAVAKGDLEGVVDEYVKNTRNTIISYLSMRKRWGHHQHQQQQHHQQHQREEIKAEEKLDEYLQHLADESAKWSHNPTKTTSDDSMYYAALREVNSILEKQNKQDAFSISEEVDRLIWQSINVLTNSRPPNTFVLFQKDDEATPLFDGTVANATPPPLGPPGLRPSGGSGTLLHLACALDSPFSLALLLSLGADVRSPHTAFRRLMIHEAACTGSIRCLQLLLELGKECALQLYKEEHLNLTPKHQHEEEDDDDDDDLPHFPMSFDSDDAKEFGLPKKPLIPQTQNWLEKLRHFHDLARNVRLGKITELDAARTILAYDTISTQSRQILAQSCSFLVKDSTILGNPFNCSWYADGHGNTPLHWASFKNEQTCVALLLQYHANPNARAHPSGWTALHDAAYSNSSESIELLLDAGAEVDARANSGATPLCFAAQEDADKAAYLLLDRGANLSARCAGSSRPDFTNGRFSGYTPLHYCAHYNALKAAKVLLSSRQAKEAMEIYDLSDRLPIHVAVARGSSDVLRELLHAGARIETSYGAPPSPRRAIAIASPPSPPRIVSAIAAVGEEGSTTPVSSPVLRSMIPARPITSNKPWNCLTQRSIDECKQLIHESSQSWHPDRHCLFTPADRLAVVELLRVGKRLEQMGTGIFVDLWPLVLSFCGRSWFEVEDEDEDEQMETDIGNSEDLKVSAMNSNENGTGVVDIDMRRN